MTTQEIFASLATPANTPSSTTPGIPASPAATLPMDSIRDHWQGHRRVTRRVIEAFPEEAFESYSIGGMRPFYELAWEIIGMSESGIKGIVTGHWAETDKEERQTSTGKTKAYILSRWDDTTELIDQLWPKIPAGRLEQVEAAYGLYDQPIFNTLLYFIDNEIHHRGQGYVYLRSLGIEPPAFWDRR